jgi:hypothetical protein
MSGTIKVTTLQDGGSATPNLVFDTSGNATVGNNLTVTGTAAMASSFKRNRIINGNMLIDQRNAGASVTPTNNQYCLDRFIFNLTQASKYTVQQNAGSVTPPVGFANYLGITSSSPYSVAAGDYFLASQQIEGFNTADFAWGTASAKSVTLSFQVYSSLTGTFGGSINNNGSSRSYPFTFTVSSANTWTSIAVTIPGDTTGTWLTNNGVGVVVRFGLGVGSTYSGTAGSWSGSTYYSATGAVSVVGTSGATFYITGVQLEVGTKATPYEMQIYSDQLAQCQRYYQNFCCGITGAVATATNIDFFVRFVQQMRTSPTYSLLTTTPLVNVYMPGSTLKTGSGSTFVGQDSTADATGGAPQIGGFSSLTTGSIVISGSTSLFSVSAEL